MKREFELVHVAEIENEIQSLLQGPYDFPKVPDLPSLRKKAKKKSAPKSKAKKFTLRALDNERENLYMVCCSQKNTIFQNATTDLRFLRKMLSTETTTKVLSIKTASLEESGKVSIIETLFPPQA